MNVYRTRTREPIRFGSNCNKIEVKGDVHACHYCGALTEIDGNILIGFSLYGIPDEYSPNAHVPAPGTRMDLCKRCRIESEHLLKNRFNVILLDQCGDCL